MFYNYIFLTYEFFIDKKSLKISFLVDLLSQFALNNFNKFVENLNRFDKEDEKIIYLSDDIKKFIVKYFIKYYGPRFGWGPDLGLGGP